MDYRMKIENHEFATGDTVTIAGVYRTIPNPDRSWWQFWKPMRVTASELERCICVGPPGELAGTTPNPSDT